MKWVMFSFFFYSVQLKPEDDFFAEILLMLTASQMAVHPPVYCCSFPVDPISSQLWKTDYSL